MNIHNLMEEVVSHRINKLYEQIKDIKATWLTCDCENCRLDTISYVLNRIPPRYVVSGRGVTHAKDILEDQQVKADIDAVGLEGIRIVSSTKRPFHNATRKECSVETSGDPIFNFPTIQGTILDGNTFEPLAGASVTLKMNGNPVPMADITWANPINTYNSTHGTYSFWPKAIEAKKNGELKNFCFTIDVSCPGYSSITYSFNTNLVAETKTRGELDTTISLKIMDLVMFRSEIVNDME